MSDGNKDTKEHPYRKPGMNTAKEHCLDCGEKVTDSKRCLRCEVLCRQVWRGRGHAIFMLFISFVGWIALAAFATLGGYLIDSTHGEIMGGSEIAGGIGFAAGAVLFGSVVAVLMSRWVNAGKESKKGDS
jgi:hypothetical protein